MTPAGAIGCQPIVLLGIPIWKCSSGVGRSTKANHLCIQGAVSAEEYEVWKERVDRQNAEDTSQAQGKKGALVIGSVNCISELIDN